MNDEKIFEILARVAALPGVEKARLSPNLFYSVTDEGVQSTLHTYLASICTSARPPAFYANHHGAADEEGILSAFEDAYSQALDFASSRCCGCGECAATEMLTMEQASAKIRAAE
jgi:hypothetical protein